MARVKLYGGLIQAARGERELDVHSSTIGEMIDSLAGSLGENFKDTVLSPDGKVKNFIRIFVNNRDIRFMNDMGTKIKEGDIVMMLPAIGGG